MVTRTSTPAPPHTVHAGASGEEAPQIGWFWDYVASLDREARQELLADRCFANGRSLCGEHGSDRTADLTGELVRAASTAALR